MKKILLGIIITILVFLTIGATSLDEYEQGYDEGFEQGRASQQISIIDQLEHNGYAEVYHKYDELPKVYRCYTK